MNDSQVHSHVPQYGPVVRTRSTLWIGIGQVVSLVVGAGVLAIPGLAIEKSQPENVMLGWLLAILLTLPFIQIFLRLSQRFPGSDGLAFFSKLAVGSWGGHAAIFLILGAAVTGFPAMAFTVGIYLQKFLGLVPDLGRYLALLILGVTLAINIFLPNKIGLLSKWTTIGLFFLVLGLSLTHIQETRVGFEILLHALSTLLDTSTNSPGSVLLYNEIWTVAALVFWAFVGFDQFTLFTGEHPRTLLPRIFFSGYILVAVSYLLLSCTITGATQMGLIDGGSTAVYNLVERHPLRIAFVAVISLVMLANMLTWMRGISRLIKSSASKGILPKVFNTSLSSQSADVAAISLFVAFIFGVIFLSLDAFSVSDFVLLANQNLMVLYSATLVAYWKTIKGGIGKVVIALSAVISLSFFLSGFTWGLLYPLCLVSLGYSWYLYRQAQLPLWIWETDHAEAFTPVNDFEIKPATPSETLSRVDRR